MQILVKHNLQLYDSADPSLREEEALVLPVRDAQALMGETVAAYLARVEWRFDLPTICKINGECYLRAEWPTRALAVNDNIEFLSRPLGSGSGGQTAKTIASVLALVAITAVTGPTGAIGSALATSFGAQAGAMLGAAIVGSAALPLVTWFTPPAPWWRRKLKAARDSLRSILTVTAKFWSLSR